MNISIIGAGNGGQAMAGHFSLLGHRIVLYNRSLDKLQKIITNNRIELIGAINDSTEIHTITDDIEKAVSGAELIMITTTANAHKDIAKKIAPYVEENQIIVLNPGRTLGAIEFSNELFENTDKKVYIAEAQSLIYACRAEPDGLVNIIGIKDKILLSAFPAIDTDFVINKLNNVFNCFVKARNVLETSLENIGAIFHPAVVLFNAAAIERGTSFYFYNDMTPFIAAFLEKLDKERIEIGKSFEINLIPVSEWVSYAYTNIEGESLCEKMQNNKAYYKIKAPTELTSRMLTEDVPTGILPLIELGKLSGLYSPLLTSVFEITQALLKTDFLEHGRTLSNLKLYNLTKEEFLKIL
ncbi:MAG: NAD/NADP octopine/nopaline dehydrogenase family protein [Bacteroidales bacterium]|jgi:opine dehydrogenase|nr:NAD/NADP octopine/nopaline dehydrogenase family protein [Bacteroidales bacterium]